MTSHVVQTSGGAASALLGKELIDRHGPESVTLLFADTLAEDDDLHRFNRDMEALTGVEITRVCDGRTPEQVDIDRRWLSNSQVAQCSLELKIKPCRAWLDANCDPADTVLYVGIGWHEMARIPGIVKGWAPWTVDMPFTRPPYRDRHQIIAELRRLGVEPPRLYGLGFEHNNCGGRCVRGGQAQWAHLLRVFPDRFAEKEAHEQRMRDMLGADVAILKDRRGGFTKPLPLTVLRNRIEDQERDAFDELDWGGCGCTTQFAEMPA
jgi:hypothetical protein